MQSVLRLRHVMAPTYVETAGGEWLNQTDDPHEYEIGSAHIKRQANRHNKIDVESNENKKTQTKARTQCYFLKGAQAANRQIEASSRWQ